MSTHYTKLIAKLRELFELDKADLDFGIYRIIAQRQTEITQFLEHDLKRNVRDILQDGQGDQREIIERELETTRKTIQDLGMDPSASPKVVELEEKLEAFKGSEHLEIQTYEHLYRFFSRYYEEGDFISQRRVSKDAKYAIPYNGEEVKLHWANADQYYIKSSENFRDYRFKLEDGRFVNFKLLEAESSRDNTKGDKRFFMLADEPVIELGNNEIQISFHYQSLAADQKKITGVDGKEKTTSQKVFNELASEAIQEQLADSWQTNVFAKAPTKANPNRTLFEKHLNDYTAKNSFDYFIHKDLGDFLSRELDFYIKNEVMELDDVIQLDSKDKLGEMLQQIKAIRRVAGLVIAFLAQLENFQRKLWLKKKFVVKSDYCFTLDRLPESLYSVIAANTEQHQEWVGLGFIAENEVVTTDLLKTNPFLLVDTRFFDAGFKYDCLSHIDDIDEQCDGLLIHGDNFQALNLLHECYREKVKCIYIDPPYNTGNDGFIYKDGYEHSSWMGLLSDRIFLSSKILKNKGNFLCSINEKEETNLSIIANNIFRAENSAEKLIWKCRQNKDNRNISKLSIDHEYVLFYGSQVTGVKRNTSQYSNTDNDHRGDWVSANMVGLLDEDQRPNLHYDLVNPETNITYEKPQMGWRYDKNTMARLIEEDRILWPEKSDGRPRRKVFLDEMTSDTTGYSSIIGEGIHTRHGSLDIDKLFGYRAVMFPKPVKLLYELISQCADNTAYTLDYFAGSGTTAHAVINLNREDQGLRKYILVEQGEYFNTVLKPRVKKVAFSEHWKDGKPIAHKDNEGTENPFNGVSHCFKTLTLESYEDTQNNLVLNRTGEQQALLDAEPAFKQDYTLNYMLDIETKGSLLNIEAFEQPFSYQMRIATDSAGETRLQNIDLIETFNYLIGLTVHTLEKLTVSIPFSKDDDGIWQAPNIIRRCEEGTADGYTFVMISGELPSGDSTFVIWRVLNDFANPESKLMHNMALDTFVKDHLNVNPKEKEIDAIFVNGDNTLPNIKDDNEHWKVRLIEEEFQRLMFAEI